MYVHVLYMYMYMYASWFLHIYMYMYASCFFVGIVFGIFCTPFLPKFFPQLCFQFGLLFLSSLVTPEMLRYIHVHVHVHVYMYTSPVVFDTTH